MSKPIVDDDTDTKVDGHADLNLRGDGNGDTATERRTMPRMSDRVRALRLEKKTGLVKRPRRRRRWLVLALLLLLALVAAYFYWPDLGRNILATETEVEAVLATSERPLDIVLDTSGYIIAHAIVKVSSRVPGRVMELCVEEGQQVKKEQLLMRLDDGQYKADLDQAKAKMAVAQAQLDELRNPARAEEVDKARAAVEQAEAHERVMARDLERANRLKDTLAPSEYDRVVANREQATASVEQYRKSLRLVELGARDERIAAAAAEVENAKALVARAQYFYDGARILSPIDGIVLQRPVELGEMIYAEAVNSSLCTLADLHKLEAEIDIQERELSDIRRGQPCLITTEAYPDREYQGRLDWLSPIYNRQRGVRRAKVVILNADELLSPDMNCRVQVLKKAPPDERRDVVHVPKEAVFEQSGRSFAYVLDGEVARLRPVQAGETNGGKTEIAGGIAAGDVVLLLGDKRLDDGQKVRPHIKQRKKSK